MSFRAWTIFAPFWMVFVTTPGPNAVNCISNGMKLPFARAMIGVLAILIYIGILGRYVARRPVRADERQARHIFVADKGDCYQIAEGVAQLETS